MVLYSAYRDFARGFSQISSYNIAIFLSVVFGDCAQGAAGLPVSKALLLQFLIAHALSLHNRTSMQSQNMWSHNISHNMRTHERDPTDHSHGALPICLVSSLVSSLAAGRSLGPTAIPTYPDCPLPILLLPAAGRLFPAAGCLFPAADRLLPTAGRLSPAAEPW